MKLIYKLIRNRFRKQKCSLIHTWNPKSLRDTFFGTPFIKNYKFINILDLFGNIGCYFLTLDGWNYSTNTHTCKYSILYIIMSGYLPWHLKLIFKLPLSQIKKRSFKVKLCHLYIRGCYNVGQMLTKLFGISSHNVF